MQVPKDVYPLFEFRSKPALKRFSLEERLMIEKHLNQGRSYREIAHLLNRPPKSIYNEIRHRSFPPNSYNGKEAHNHHLRRMEGRTKKLKKIFSQQDLSYIKDRLNIGISIKQIAVEVGSSEKRIKAALKENALSTKSECIGILERINSLEEQVKILFENLMELKNDRKN